MARRRKSVPAPPFALGFEAWMLGAEAASVIALRTAKLALGGAEAQVEAQRMVTEKAEAAWAVGVALATGGFGTNPETIARRTVKHYSKAVSANHRRLSKRK